MIKCISHKKTYPSQEIAEDALIEAHTHFDYGTRSGPVNVYQCDDCGHYHLTSQGTMNARLAQLIKEGTLQRQKEAQHWTSKLKRK